MGRIYCASRAFRVAASVLTAIALCSCGNPAVAGVISIVDIPAVNSDANSGISTDNTYTHAIDFTNRVGTLTINGVPFTQVNTPSGTGYSMTPNNGTLGCGAGDGGSQHPSADGNMGYMLNCFNYTIYDNAPNPVGATLTLTGLTPGVTYSTRLYYTYWGDGSHWATFTFNGDGDNTSIHVDEDAVQNARYLKYDFTASGTTETITGTADSSGKWYYSWHWYGISNQVAVPEPNAFALLATGLLGLLAYAWRKRR